MAELLRPIPLAELKLLAQGRCWTIDQSIAGLDTLTPVQGELSVCHHRTALEITARAETIITLCCDRCLQHYNHALQADVHELVELRGLAESDLQNPDLDDCMEIGQDLDDRLDPDGRFDPEHWLFEQLSLRLPLVNRCGDDCPGPACWSSDPVGVDPRWAALSRLRSSVPGSDQPAAG